MSGVPSYLIMLTVALHIKHSGTFDMIELVSTTDFQNDIHMNHVT